jgi:hypothetical protein
VTKEEVKIRFKSINAKPFALKNVARFYQAISGIPDILFLYWFGFTKNYNVLITGSTDFTMEDLYQYLKCGLSIKSILIIFDQILAYPEKIYKGFYIHDDINTENIYVGLGKIRY